MRHYFLGWLSLDRLIFGRLVFALIWIRGLRSEISFRIESSVIYLLVFPLIPATPVFRILALLLINWRPNSSVIVFLLRLVSLLLP